MFSKYNVTNSTGPSTINSHDIIMFINTTKKSGAYQLTLSDTNKQCRYVLHWPIDQTMQLNNVVAHYSIFSNKTFMFGSNKNFGPDTQILKY